MTPLMLAAKVGNFPVLKYLLEYVPEAKATLKYTGNMREGYKNISGWSALHLAAKLNRKDCYDLLVEHGANENAKL